MKKALFSIFALVAFISSPLFASANFTGDVAQYYQNNKAEYTLDVGSLGNISITDYVPGYSSLYGRTATYFEHKVICKISYNMCYSAATALRAFGIDLNAFAKWYEKVTGKTLEFVNLHKKLYVAPSIK